MLKNRLWVYPQFILERKKKTTTKLLQFPIENCHFYSRKNPKLTVMQSIFKPLLSETDEVNRCERFPLTPCARTFQNKEYIHYNTMNCRAKVGGPDSGSAWCFLG